MFSRTKSKKTGEFVEKSENFPHIKDWASFNVPKDTIFVGEVYVVGGHSNDVTKLTGCLPSNAVQRQFNTDLYGGPAHYYIFDIIRFKGEDLQDKPTIERIEKYLYGEQLNFSFVDQKYIERAKTYYDNFEEALHNIFAKGGEGMVFKNKTCPYRAGKRSTVSQMFKWKEHMDSIDLVCMRLEDPEYYYTGKESDTWPYRDEDGKLITKPAYYHWKNSMALGCYDENKKLIEIGKVASGLTDEMREDMALYPEKYLNKVVQISCMSLNSIDKTIRHPVFEQMRYDKNPSDCLLKEIFAN